MPAVKPIPHGLAKKQSVGADIWEIGIVGVYACAPTWGSSEPMTRNLSWGESLRKLGEVARPLHDKAALMHFFNR